MNTETQGLDVRQYLTKHLIEVFETMLSFPAEIVAGGHTPNHPTRVTGSVGFGGENVTGAVYLHLSGDFAVKCASAMLGLTPEEIGETDVNDVVGEMTNMLAGGLKSALCDAGSACAVSTPAIIRGTSFEIEAMPDVQREQMIFRSGDQLVVVEVHIKYN